eukprot:7787757-Prorocentrum_lima.AAC.1
MTKATPVKHGKVGTSECVGGAPEKNQVEKRKVVLFHHVFGFFPFGENFSRRDVKGGDFEGGL